MFNRLSLTFADQGKLGHIPYSPGCHGSLGDRSHSQGFAASPLLPWRTPSGVCCMETSGDRLVQPWIRRAGHSPHSGAAVLLGRQSIDSMNQPSFWVKQNVTHSLLLACVSVCVRVLETEGDYLRMSGLTYRCVHMWREEVAVSIDPHCIFWDRISHWTRNSPLWGTGWPASPGDTPDSASTSDGVTDVTSHAWLFHGCWGSRLKHSCLDSKNLTFCVTS